MGAANRRARRVPWAILTTLLLASTGLPTVSAASPDGAAATDTSGYQAQVEPQVLKEISGKGSTTFWVYLRDQADLSQANEIQDWNARGQFVYDQLRKNAGESQAGVIAHLEKIGAQYQPFWIANVIKVTAGADALADLAAMPGVTQVTADKVYSLVEPQKGETVPAINTVEWGVANIRANEVWSGFGARGEGIVVGSIDTGVMYTHPALVNHYRGNNGDGTFNHNYSWWDPSHVCGNPSTAPCDNNGHATHVTGTMVGSDGGANEIGVAPAAKWISAKGCESSSCSTEALLSSGQFMLAPTDLNGQNADPSKRPHVVNNSWGGGGNDGWYQATVTSWVAAGIFPAFANGNAGPGCGSVGQPGMYLNSYGVGAYDINNTIAGFSSRGPAPAPFTGIKPNISAPGVNIRSSWNDGTYNSISGTSMATPHLSGAVALLWSAAPALIGDIAATRALLDQTAVNASDLSCGGTPENNNVYGEGRLDIFAATDLAPRGPTGTIAGTVTSSGDGAPIAGSSVQAVSGTTVRNVRTDATGHYSIVAPVGAYDMTVSAFGFAAGSASGVAVVENQTTTRDFPLAPAPSGTLSGVVHDGNNQPVAGATVSITGTPIPPATADATGHYSFASVPEGTYMVTASSGQCYLPQEQSVTVTGSTIVDFALAARTDAFGYGCQALDGETFETAANVAPITGDDLAGAIALPFPVVYYGETYNNGWVCTNGIVGFGSSPACPFSNSGIPSAGQPNAAIYPFWDDLFVDASASIRTELKGAAPDRRFVIEFRNVGFFSPRADRLTFNVVLHENGRIMMQYADLDNPRERGNSATVGIENHTGATAFQYAFNQDAVHSGLSLLFRLPPSGFVAGTVTNANDHQAVSGATVTLRQGATAVRTVTTSATGEYRTQLSLGAYTVEASANNYTPASAQVELTAPDATVRADFALTTARAVVTPGALEFLLVPGKTRTATLKLSNTGSADLSWEVLETGGNRVRAAAEPATLTALALKPDHDPNTRTTEGLYTGAAPAQIIPSAVGDVIKQWPATGLSLPWGVGYDGNVWLSDPLAAPNRNTEFTEEGAGTGRSHSAPWVSAFAADMAPVGDMLCQVNVGGDNGIYCWNKSTGAVVDQISGSFPWTATSQRGLAYRPDDDSFYIGGWNEDIVYHLKGLGHADKGALIGQCRMAAGSSISGMAWNPTAGALWVASNSPTDTIYRVNPETCSVVSTLAHPNPGFNGAGLEMDNTGNLWMVSQNGGRAYLLESGVPHSSDVPWLTVTPASGSLAPGGSASAQVTIDTTGLVPGVYTASLLVRTNSGRQSSMQVPVLLVVSAYQQGVDAGSRTAYTDANTDVWAADKAYTAGGWGYTGVKSKAEATKKPIAGTVDDALYQTARTDAGEYRFDGLASGVYQVELRFAEIQGRQPGKRVFDVLIENQILLFAYDISAVAGENTADSYTFYATVTDGQLNVRIPERKGYQGPIINGLRVTHRPDR